MRYLLILTFCVISFYQFAEAQHQVIDKQKNKEDELVVTSVGKFEILTIDPNENEISPTEIKHVAMDEIIAGDANLDSSNFLIYSFKTDDVHYIARTNLDKIEEVSVVGPFKNSDNSRESFKNNEYFEEVIGYLKRRYKHVKAFGEKGFEAILKDPN